MRKEVIKFNGDLKREVWTFDLSVGFDPPCIYLNDYSFQTRPSTRHKNWLNQTHWQRFDRRSNNIEHPPIPLEVETEARSYFQEAILKLPITT